MVLGLKNFLRSARAKKIFLFLSFLLVLFIVCNDFLLPWYVKSGGNVDVPGVVGQTFEDARRILDSRGLEAKKGDVRMDREHAAGIVIIQNPAEGSNVKRGRRVYLTISGGEVLVDVPNIKGRTVRDAKFALEREGLKLGGIEYQPSDQFPANTIVEQLISPGTKVKRDKYVSVIVSQGVMAEKVTVPDLHGKNLTESEKILVSTGLKIGNISYVPSSYLLPNIGVDQFSRF